MGTLELDCPLCCSETFPCHNSLKYHLLSISDNLICSACGKRFEKIIDLAMHLGRQCLDPEREITNTEVLIENSDTNIVQSNSNRGRNPYLSEKNVSATEVGIKEEGTVNETELGTIVTNSILAKALMKNAVAEKSDSNEITENTTLEDEAISRDQASEEDVYYCSSCAISFTSIEDHLQEFHEGHEVFVEEEETMNASLDNSPLPIIDEEHDDDDEDECDNDDAEILCAAELLDTVQEEECVDKDGRLYIRKVVKIEKFWDDKDIKTKNSNEENSIVTIKNNTFQETILLENIQGLSNNSKNKEDLLEIYQCSKCEKKFSTLEHSSKHKCPALRVDSNKYKKCKICKTHFVSSKFLSAHMKIHKPKTSSAIPDPNPPFICEICNTEFSTYKSLRLHRRMHEPIKSKDIEPPVTYGILGEELGTEDVPQEMFICQICNKPYNKEYEEAHKKFHSKDIDFNCDICNRKFFTRENLDMHMRAHSDTKKFTCSYCKKGFLTNEKLEAHMSSKCQKRQYECQYCGRRFARPHEKVKHERIHTGEKPHVCEICGKAFRVSYCLTLHMRTHSGTRPYKCDHCGKRFKAHSVYNHHLLTHSDDRKYKCPFCPKTFKTGVQLAGHKNSHTKPFTCTECNRPFASLYAVRAHMETHQRQNNLKYRCWLCGASYARAFALRDHIREQHVGEHDNNTEADAIILETDDYSMTENVEPNTPILADGDESMLIDIGSEVVDNMEIPDVQVEPDLQDNGGT